MFQRIHPQVTLMNQFSSATPILSWNSAPNFQPYPVPQFQYMVYQPQPEYYQIPMTIIYPNVVQISPRVDNIKMEQDMHTNQTSNEMQVANPEKQDAKEDSNSQTNKDQDWRDNKITKKSKNILHKKKGKGFHWDDSEVELLTQLYDQYNGRWKKIVRHFEGRNISQCSQKLRKVIKDKNITMDGPHEKLKWTQEEDELVLKGYKEYGHDWINIAAYLPRRNSKQVRERFLNKLDPRLNKDSWSEKEDELLLSLFKVHGNKWSVIAKNMGNRPQNLIKNRFYYHIQKKYLGKEHSHLQIAHGEIESEQA